MDVSEVRVLLDALPGEPIDGVVKNAVALAYTQGHPVFIRHNDRLVEVSPSDNLTQVYERWSALKPEPKTLSERHGITEMPSKEAEHFARVGYIQGLEQQIADLTRERDAKQARIATLSQQVRAFTGHEYASVDLDALPQDDTYLEMVRKFALDPRLIVVLANLCREEGL